MVPDSQGKITGQVTPISHRQSSICVQSEQGLSFKSNIPLRREAKIKKDRVASLDRIVNPSTWDYDLKVKMPFAKFEISSLIRGSSDRMRIIAHERIYKPINIY